MSFVIKNKKIFAIVYELIMAFLALCVAIILTLQTTSELNEDTLSLFNTIDTLIWVIFVIDYFVRLFIAEDKKYFLKSNIIELISIIPLDSIVKATRLFRVAKLSKLSRTFKLLRFLRLIAVLGRFKKKLNVFIKTNNFNYVIWLTMVIILLGAVGMYLTENKPFVDCIWWSFVTATTVGYGDISPATNLGRAIAAVLMIVGIGFIGMLTGTIATFFIDKNKEPTYRNELVQDIKNRLDNFDTMTSEEVDDICKVLRSLKE